MTMFWKNLLNPSRLGCPPVENQEEVTNADVRSEFQRDYDRIVFSTAFRRLQGKTQVFPLPETDMVHNRLTHSIETACVGRSLGATVARDIDELSGWAFDVAAVVSAACLAHDIGNPPFGHAGEAAIAHFFSEGPGRSISELFSSDESLDFSRFGGNAAGFRVLTSHKPTQTTVQGGLGLTLPTLAAFTKYPRTASYVENTPTDSRTKSGLFLEDARTYSSIAENLGILEEHPGQAWVRHPLAFLTEAADDICYRILDLEDGFKLGLIDYRTAESLLTTVIETSNGFVSADSLSKINDNRQKVGYLRAKSIYTLVLQAAAEFCNSELEIAEGKYSRPLLESAAASSALYEIKRVSIEQVYSHTPVVQVEAAGFEILSGLLDVFLNAALIAPHTEKSKKILSLVPPEYSDQNKPPDTEQYQVAMNIVEFVSCMTDTYAIDLFRILKGISLPNYSP